MKRLFVLAFLVLQSSPALANEQFVIHRSPTVEVTVGPPEPLYGNTPQGEHAGDAPWVNRNLARLHPFVFWFKDTNEAFASVNLDYLRLYRENGATDVLIGEYDPPGNYNIASDYWFARLDHDLTVDGATIGQTIEYYFEVRYTNWGGFTNTDTYVVRVLIAPALPFIAGWFAAETHFHCFFTDDDFEYGGQLSMIAAVAPVVGIQFVPISEHSYDVVMVEWNSLVSFCQMNSTSTLVLSPALETNSDDNTTNNSPDGFLHQLALGINTLIPAPAEFPSDNQSSQLWTLSRVGDDVVTAMGKWMAAHPFSLRLYLFGMQVYENVQYDQTDITTARQHSGFIGWQVWNGDPKSHPGDVDEDYANPFPFQPNPNWDQPLRRSMAIVDSLRQSEFSPGSFFTFTEPLSGLSVNTSKPLRNYVTVGNSGYVWLEFETAGGFRAITNPIWIGANPGFKDFWFAGSDAHGSYNYHWYLRVTGGLEASDRAFGKVFNWVRATSLTEANVLAAYAAGRSAMTDGPLAFFAIDVDNNGSGEIELGNTAFGVTTQSTLVLRGESTSDFGAFTQVKINVFQVGPLTGVGPTRPQPLSVLVKPNPSSGGFAISFRLDAPTPTQVAVYTVRGELVAELLNDTVRGDISLSWQDQRLASGVYLVKTTAGGQTVTHKITLVR